MKNFEDRLAAFHGDAFMARDEFVNEYASPHEVSSIFKGVPIKYLESFKAL